MKKRVPRGEYVERGAPVDDVVREELRRSRLMLEAYSSLVMASVRSHDEVSIFLPDLPTEDTVDRCVMKWFKKWKDDEERDLIAERDEIDQRLRALNRSRE